MLNPKTILCIILCHLALIMLISFISSRKSSNSSFFNAGKKSPWWLVSWGVIGAVISGVTFISVPGTVGVANGANTNFSYMQLILGNAVGYLIIAWVLLPTFYRMKLISIYGYLDNRFGSTSKTVGAVCFMVSRVFGSSLRLFLVVLVLQKFVLNAFDVPFWVTAIIVPGVIWLYTFQGGTKTIIVTDSIQTALFIGAIVLTINDIGHYFHTGFMGMISKVYQSKYSETFYLGNLASYNSFFKQFFGGILIAIGTSGLDQDVMQKNLACKNIKDSQKNIYTSTSALIAVNFLFLVLGGALYLMAANKGIALPNRADEMYPMMAFNHLSALTAIVFILGLVACSYSSADSALTALTTSFCIDFLSFKKKEGVVAEHVLKRNRVFVHVGFTLCFILIILLLNVLGKESIVNILFKFTGYLYGPLIGLFAFGFLTRYKIKEVGILPSCLIAIAGTIFLDVEVPVFFNGFSLGLLIWIVNPLIMFLSLFLFRKPGLDYVYDEANLVNI